MRELQGIMLCDALGESFSEPCKKTLWLHFVVFYINASATVFLSIALSEIDEEDTEEDYMDYSHLSLLLTG